MKLISLEPQRLRVKVEQGTARQVSHQMMAEASQGILINQEMTSGVTGQKGRLGAWPKLFPTLCPEKKINFFLSFGKINFMCMEVTG